MEVRRAPHAVCGPHGITWRPRQRDILTFLGDRRTVHSQTGSTFTERELYISLLTSTCLFERLCGRPAVVAVVKEFYKRVLSDSQLAGFFADTNIDFQTQQ